MCIISSGIFIKTGVNGQGMLSTQCSLVQSNRREIYPQPQKICVLISGVMVSGVTVLPGVMVLRPRNRWSYIV